MDKKIVEHGVLDTQRATYVVLIATRMNIYVFWSNTQRILRLVNTSKSELFLYYPQGGRSKLVRHLVCTFPVHAIYAYRGIKGKLHPF